MADLNVKRKGPGVVPWVIGLLVLALVIWLLAGMFGADAPPVDEDTMENTELVDSLPATPP